MERKEKKKLERKAVFLPQAHAPPSRRTSSKKPEVLNVGGKFRLFIKNDKYVMLLEWRR